MMRNWNPLPESAFGFLPYSHLDEDEVLQGLPQLSCRDRATFDADIFLEELTAAVGQMASGRAPGLDGLPADLYKCF